MNDEKKYVLKAVERDRPIKPRKNKTFTHLRICPVCGGPADFRDDECYGHAHCTHCLARTDDFDSWRNKNWKEDAARDWNDRTYPPEVQAAVERDKPKKPDLKTENKMSFYVCESCGNKVFKGMNVCDECGQRLNWEDE